MLGNTLVLPQVGGNITLIKINQDNYSSEYLFKDANTQYNAKIRHSRTKATALRPSYDRHNFEVVQTVYATGGNPEFQRKFYFVLEALASDTNVILADAVSDLAIATSNAFLVSLLAWES